MSAAPVAVQLLEESRMAGFEVLRKVPGLLFSRLKSLDLFYINNIVLEVEGAANRAGKNGTRANFFAYCCQTLGASVERSTCILEKTGISEFRYK